MDIGAKLIVNGNCGTKAGSFMHAGELTINGNEEEGLGHYMKGGTIHVNGNIKSLGPGITGGNIFQYGRQLVKDGVVIDQPQNK
jgi:formylmethanofuran dehydrogenase subunit C